MDGGNYSARVGFGQLLRLPAGALRQAAFSVDLHGEIYARFLYHCWWNTDFPPLRRGTVGHPAGQRRLSLQSELSALPCQRRTESSRGNVRHRWPRLIVQLSRCMSDVSTLDITGGAPEMNTHFRYLVREGRKRVICASSTAAIFPSSRSRVRKISSEFLAEQRCRRSSHPCPATWKRTSTRNGATAVFDTPASDGLRRLNALGYGIAGLGADPRPGLQPAGTRLLPPAQDRSRAGLQDGTRMDALRHFHFNQLYVRSRQYAGWAFRQYADFERARWTAIWNCCAGPIA